MPVLCIPLSGIVSVAAVGWFLTESNAMVENKLSRNINRADYLDLMIGISSVVFALVALVLTVGGLIAAAVALNLKHEAIRASTKEAKKVTTDLVTPEELSRHIVKLAAEGRLDSAFNVAAYRMSNGSAHEHYKHSNDPNADLR